MLIPREPIKNNLTGKELEEFQSLYDDVFKRMKAVQAIFWGEVSPPSRGMAVELHQIKIASKMQDTCDCPKGARCRKGLAHSNKHLFRRKTTIAPLQIGRQCVVHFASMLPWPEYTMRQDSATGQIKTYASDLQRSVRSTIHGIVPNKALQLIDLPDPDWKGPELRSQHYMTPPQHQLACFLGSSRCPPYPTPFWPW